MEKLPSISDLKATIQPDPKKETVWYAKYVIRKISIYFTWVLLHTPLTANQATFIQAALGIAGSALLAFGGYNWSVLALVLIQLGYIFDCIDGEIARYRNKPSINGIFLDSLNHPVCGWMMQRIRMYQVKQYSRKKKQPRLRKYYPRQAPHSKRSMQTSYASF